MVQRLQGRLEAPATARARNEQMAMMRTAVTRKVMEAEPVATFHRVVCPQCGGVQGAAVVYHGVRKPWRGYVCLFCGEGVDESRWQEVEDGK